MVPDLHRYYVVLYMLYELPQMVGNLMGCWGWEEKEKTKLNFCYGHL